MARPRLVQEGEGPPRKLSAAEAAELGDTRATLVAARRVVARAVDDPSTPKRELAALTKRLLEIMREIEAIDAREDQEHGADPGDGAFDASAV